MPTPHVSYLAHNPFRRPDWRFERALFLVDHNRRSSPGRDDAPTRMLRNFLQRHRAAADNVLAHDALAARNPGLFWAWQLHARRSDDHNHRALILEARLLARQSDAEIAADAHILPETVDWYEKLFFNVRDRLDAHDWILDQVLVPAYLAFYAAQQAAKAAGTGGNILCLPFFDPTLKFFAYFGGPFVLNHVLSGYRRGNLATGADEVSGWMDGQFSGRARQLSAQTAQNLEVNRYNAMELFTLHAKLIEMDRSVNNAEQAKDAYAKALSALMKEMSWAVGEEGRKMVEGTIIEAYDKQAAELRDAEVLQLSSGTKADTIKGIEQLKLPPPRPADETAPSPNSLL